MHLLTLVLALCCASNAWAHKASTSYLQLRIDGGELSGRWDIALRDLDYALGLDLDNDLQLTWGEVLQQRSRITGYALQRLGVRADNAPCSVRAPDLLIVDHSDGSYASLVLSGRCPADAFALGIDYQLLFDVDALHRALLRLDFLGTHAGVFAPHERSLRFVTPQASRTRVFLQYLRTGIWHVAAGWDHLLFLIGLFLPAVLRRQGAVWQPAASLRPVLVDLALLVTMFSLAHALTLSLAATGWLTLPTRAVESAVAATVVFAGLNNLVPMVYRRLAWLAGAFGLVHGAAMAGSLLELGLPAADRVWALLAFNIGIELAQLALLLLVVAPAFAVRGTLWYRWLILVPGSLAICAVGLQWLLLRAWNINLGIPAP